MQTKTNNTNNNKTTSEKTPESKNDSDTATPKAVEQTKTDNVSKPADSDVNTDVKPGTGPENEKEEKTLADKKKKKKTKKKSDVAPDSAEKLDQEPPPALRMENEPSTEGRGGDDQVYNSLPKHEPLDNPTRHYFNDGQNETAKSYDSAVEQQPSRPLFGENQDMLMTPTYPEWMTSQVKEAVVSSGSVTRDRRSVSSSEQQSPAQPLLSPRHSSIIPQPQDLSMMSGGDAASSELYQQASSYDPYRASFSPARHVAPSSYPHSSPGQQPLVASYQGNNIQHRVLSYNSENGIDSAQHNYSSTTLAPLRSKVKDQKLNPYGGAYPPTTNHSLTASPTSTPAIPATGYTAHHYSYSGHYHASPTSQHYSNRFYSPLHEIPRAPNGFHSDIGATGYGPTPLPM